MALTERNRVFALDELRASPRETVEIEARIAIDGELSACVFKDLSQTGAFARMSWVPAGTVVMIWFRLPTQVIEIDATARWSNAQGVGLQFGALRAKDAYALGQYLATLRLRG